ncbi:regulator of g protein signaling [Anaeramoeba flamelloides]|uniref:Regulator of g protein signaling n=1 Tax=Anaeramoeba flamelloides TaxID=1746091 RepID=A0ABQ8YPP1_9EUKA|nr:regulator of g protein signaling [Anaeramoeba flamelloides]
MKRRNVSPINVRSKILTSIFTFSGIAFLIILGFFDSKSYKYSCQFYVMITFFHQTFTIWIYLVQAWRVHFIYLLNKEKLQSIKRFIKSVNTEETTSTSKEKKTSRLNEEQESSILNSTAESHFWEGIIEDDDEEGINKKFQKVERKFYQKRIHISGKYMSLAILLHFLLMLIFITLIQLVDKVEKMPDNSCDYGNYFVPFIASISLLHILLFSYYLIKIWKIKDNFKIRNQLYMIFITCLLTTVIMTLKTQINKKIMWQWPFGFILIVQYWIVLGYPLWLSRKQHSLAKNTKKKNNNSDNEDNEDTVEKFTHVLNDKNKSKYFFKFLQLDYSIENLLFYQAVTSFEKINPNKKTKKKKYCQQIINNFIKVDARLEVNLDHSTRNNTLELTEKDPTNSACFEEAKQKIFFLMFSGSYPNFLSSKQYYEMMIEIDQINIEIGGERELELNPLGDDEDDHENGEQLSNDTKKESGIDTKNENGIIKYVKNQDKNEDEEQKKTQSNTSSESESSEQNKTSSETSNSDSDSD